MTQQQTLGREFWNAKYTEQTRLWSGNPNPVLVTETRHLAPGRALDLGCGEGGDAIWLAEQGWRVTAVDVSDVAVQRARELAAERGAPGIEWVCANLADWRPDGGYDLVSAQFLYDYPELRDSVLRKVADATNIGGTLLIGLHPDLPEGMEHDPGHHTGNGESLRHLMFAPEDVAALLAPEEWRIEVCEIRQRPDTDGLHHRDGILRARRTGEHAR